MTTATATTVTPTDAPAATPTTILTAAVTPTDTPTPTVPNPTPAPSPDPKPTHVPNPRLMAVDAPDFAKWRESLPADLRDDPSLIPIKDWGTMVKSYVSAQKMVGAEKIPVPSKHATPEEWNHAFKKLGLPDSIEKYEVKPKDANTADAEFLNEFKQRAFEANILPDQAQKLLDWYDEKMGGTSKEVQAEIERVTQEGITGLKNEWGKNFDTNLKVAYRAAKHFGGDSLIKYMDETGIGNDPIIIKLFANLGQNIREDVFKPGAVGEFNTTQQQARDKINSINADMKHPYWDGMHANHKQAVEEMTKLYKIVHGLP